MRTFTPRHEIITLETVQSWKPCSHYTDQQIKELVGDGITLDRFRTLTLPPADVLWCLLHVEAIGERLCHEASCVFATRSIELYWPNPDQRSVNAIAVKRRWLAGEATDDELEAARAAAWAARAAAGAARAAAGAAAWAARAAARDAAWADELSWQLAWIWEHVE